MLPVDIEKLVLGSCLAYPNGTENLPQRIVHELDLSRFDGTAHPHIYQAIKSCVAKRIVPNPANVALEMKSVLDKAGGIEYLESLTRFPSLIGVYDTQGIDEWVRQVDLLGRARLIHIALNQRVNVPLEEFQKRVIESSDPDAYLSQLTLEVNRYVSGTRSEYRPFSDAIAEFKERIKVALNGEVNDILPCAIPSLEKYCIPRPKSFGVIAGISNQGKTQFALYLAVGVSIELQRNGDEGQVVINTLEEQGADLAMRVACMMAGINSLDIAHAKINSQQGDRLFEKCDFIEKLPIVYNDDPTITSSQFVTHAISQHLKKPRRLGITDYVELFADKLEDGQERVAQATRNVKSVCYETGSCETMLVQLNDSATSSSYKTGGMFASRSSRVPAHAADWWIEILNYPELRKAQMKVTVPDRRNGDLAYALIEKGRKYGKGEEAFEWTAEFTLFRDTALPPGKIYRDPIKQDEF